MDYNSFTFIYNTIQCSLYFPLRQIYVQCIQYSFCNYHTLSMYTGTLVATWAGCGSLVQCAYIHLSRFYTGSVPDVACMTSYTKPSHFSAFNTVNGLRTRLVGHGLHRSILMVLGYATLLQMCYNLLYTETRTLPNTWFRLLR